MTSLTRRSRSSMWRGLAVASVLVLTLGACSDDGDDDPDGQGTGSAAPSADAGGTDSSSPGTEGDDQDSEGGDAPDLPQAPAIVKPQGATEDVTRRGSCGLDPGEQDVGGRVSNPTKRTLDYVITVSWVSDDGRVRGRAIAVVDDVPPGDKKSWNTTADVLDDATACVTNALRGRTKS